MLVLFKNKWVALEVKSNKNSHHQPNQDLYVKRMNEMSYAAFIFPENEEKILSKVEEVFAS